MKCNVGRAIILYIINMYLHTSRKKYYLEKFETIKFYIEYNTCTVSGQKYSDKMIFYYIFHIKPQFLKTLFQSQFLFDFDEIFLPTEASAYVLFCDYFLGAQILNVHDLSTNLNYLSSNVLSLYCIFDIQNLVLCLNRELIKIIDYKYMLKLV